ncbi:MAG: hypothetical protein IT288_00890 [Bdellovibrionales bacterium]|nr:hypothetical protein [Bdellovibrionales bacterium]
MAAVKLVLSLVVAIGALASSPQVFANELKVYQVEGFFEQEVWGSLTLEPGQVIRLRADHVDPWSRRNHTPQQEFTWVLRGFDSGTLEVFDPNWRYESEHFRLLFNEVEFRVPDNIKTERYSIEIRDRTIGHQFIWLY